MKKNLNRTLALLLALLMALALTACGQKQEAPSNDEPAPATQESANTEETPSTEADANVETADSQGDKHITLTVTYSDETSDVYEIDTSAEYLKDAIESTVDLGGSESEYGFFIESVNGESADYNTDGAYWAIFVNDDYGMYGIDQQPVTDGDSYALVYTVG